MSAFSPLVRIHLRHVSRVLDIVRVLPATHFSPRSITQFRLPFHLVAPSLVSLPLLRFSSPNLVALTTSCEHDPAQHDGPSPPDSNTTACNHTHSESQQLLEPLEGGEQQVPLYMARLRIIRSIFMPPNISTWLAISAANTLVSSTLFCKKDFFCKNAQHAVVWAVY